MFKKTTICLISAAALAVAQTTPPTGGKPTPGNCPGDCTGGSKKAKDVCFTPDGGFTGSRLFARNDWVRVSICGVNPAGFVYRVVLDEQVVNETVANPLPTSFLTASSTTAQLLAQSSVSPSGQQAHDQFLSLFNSLESTEM